MRMVLGLDRAGWGDFGNWAEAFHHGGTEARRKQQGEQAIDFLRDSVSPWWVLFGPNDRSVVKLAICRVLSPHSTGPILLLLLGHLNCAGPVRFAT